MPQAMLQTGAGVTPGEEVANPPVGSPLQQMAAMRDEVRQLHRLTMLGTAAATIAHEFNNLLTPVIGYAKYSLDSGDVELMKKALQMTLKQSAIATAMSDRILGVAASESQTVQAVRVREVVEEAVACLCRDLAKDGITLTIDVSEGLTVHADPTQLHQVLFNLLINARQAIGEQSGAITIAASGVDDDSVAISVRDNGCGIPPDMVDRIFDPFVTSKSGGKSGRGPGVGLGLAVCRDIVHENRGTISVDSEVGVGTTFRTVLPAAS
ncbi:MAG: hypothetical protein JSV19_05065 [Phycisphaerales bacterium]|nr:MAG: hypothetical protein JSV19_05065 [Phycisphaerales bacterium]